MLSTRMSYTRPLRSPCTATDSVFPSFDSFGFPTGSNRVSVSGQP
jgi:hypothetical protein